MLPLEHTEIGMKNNFVSNTDTCTPSYRKREKGFAGFGLMEYMVIGSIIIAVITSFIWPMIRNNNENQTANQIVFSITAISQAAFDSPYGAANDYTGSSASDLDSFLPEGFSWTVNGDTLTYAVNSNPTKFDISIPVTNPRVLDRLKAKYKSSQYSVAGTTFTVTGP